MLKHYDFSKGVRGKYAGQKITVEGPVSHKEDRSTNKYEVVVPITGFIIYEVDDAKSAEEAKKIVANMGGKMATKTWQESLDTRTWKSYTLDPYYDTYAEHKFGVEPEGF